ncbi:MAG: orotidine 5'-phosphate decarboxylase / HUMPS family protein, partial [Candidatus Poseidoniaceae archaeon]
MEASDAWKERWEASTLPMAKTFMEVACRKQSLVCLAADRYTMAELFELLTAVGSSIAALKTHVDLVADWTAEEWNRFCILAQEMDLLIFEDRKFADIG